MRASAREVPIRFRLLNEDHVTVDIVDSSDAIVRERLLSGRYDPRSVLFSWDGRTAGRVVADGLYRLRITLADEGRTLEVPEIRVDGTPPTIENVEVRPRVISPDGDRRSDRASISYRFSEPAYAVLYVDGKRRPGSSFRKRPAGVLQWYGLGLRPGDAPACTGRAGPGGQPVALDTRVRSAGAIRRARTAALRRPARRALQRARLDGFDDPLVHPGSRAGPSSRSVPSGESR